MDTITQLIKPTNGKITIEVPIEFANKELEVTIKPIFTNQDNLNDTDKKYDFSDLLGKQQWKGDALNEQQKIRNEWK